MDRSKLRKSITDIRLALLSIESEINDATDDVDEIIVNPENFPDFVYIPVGIEFIMGTTSPYQLGNRESPPHTVKIKNGFFISKKLHTEVNGYPKTKIAHHEASEYLKSIGMRLPTEAEWECACRAGTTTDFYNGDLTNTGCADQSLDKIAWYCGNSSKYQPIGKKKPNAWGLYDMLGNVMEWVEDDWHDGYSGAPNDGSPWLGGRNKVVRGGAYSAHARYCRCAWRGGVYEGTRSKNIGFRACFSADDIDSIKI